MFKRKKRKKKKTNERTSWWAGPTWTLTGGVLPTLPQRTLGVGGTAGMVHPSTGFMAGLRVYSHHM